MAITDWPQVIVEGGFAQVQPVQPAGTFLLDDVANGLLDTNTLGSDVTWTDITAWVRSGSVSRPASRQQGPVYDYQVGTLSLVLNNKDGRFDPDNLAGPYVAAGVSELAPMVPVRVSAVWNGTRYYLFTGFADSWTDDGQNYAGRYAQLTLSASDGQKVLNGITLPATAPTGAGESTDDRVNRVLNAARWFTGTEMRTIYAGSSTVQAYAGGDTAWNLMKAAADSEAGELYVSGTGAVVFRGRQAILTDARSNSVQVTLGDRPESVQAGGTEEEPYAMAPHILDDATLANDIQATRTGGALQEAQDAASVSKYLFPRSYSRSDLILQNDADVLNWAEWVLYISSSAENRVESVTLSPLRDPADLWPHALGREIGDRIRLWRRPPEGSGIPYSSASATSPGVGGTVLSVPVAAGTYTFSWMVTLAGTVSSADDGNFSLYNGAALVATSVNNGAAGDYPQGAVTVTVSPGDLLTVKAGAGTPTTGAVYAAAIPAPVIENCLIRGITHDWDWGAQQWTTTWTLQDAAKYASFLTLDNAILGQLDFNALAY